MTFRRLNPDAPVGLRAGACLPLRSRHTECDRCVEVCPAGVLHRGEEVFSLDEGCLGCGRCAAACPMGALRIDGFSIGLPAAARGHAVAVDCRKVPPEISTERAVRVPCLGGLAVSDLLALRLVAGRRTVVLHDRGWCAQCPAGAGVSHPLETALSTARAWLAETGVPARLLPRLERRPLPPAVRPSGSPAAPHAMSAPRRAFLKRLTGGLGTALSEAVAPEAAAARAADPRPAREPVRSFERERRLGLLRRLAANYGGRVPAELFPVLEVDASCRNHQLCVTLCPTGALRAYTAKETRGIAFDAAACIACGQCLSACPERAISLLPQRANHPPRQPSRLTHHEARGCAQCGREFYDRSDEVLCLGCRRAQDFAKTAFDTLFFSETAREES